MSVVRKQSLRAKISLTIIVTITIVLLGIGTVFLLNTRKVIETLMNSNREMGQTSQKKSSASMDALTQTRLQELASNKAALADRIFLEFEQAVETAAAAAERLYADPDSYPPRDVALPRMENDGILTLQALFATGVDPDDESIRAEVRLLGNLQDTLYAINLNNGNVASNYVATESGIMIQADFISAKKFDEAGNLMLLDAKTRPWYKGAAESGTTFLTPVVRDLHTPRLAVMCGVPVYRDGVLMAVAGAGMYLDDVEALVRDMELGENGEACLINQAGQVLFSSYQDDSQTTFYPGRDLVSALDPSLNLLAEKAISQESGIELLELNQISSYIAYSPMKTTGWSVFIVMPQDIVEAPTKQLETELSQISDQAARDADGQIRSGAFWLLLVLGIAALAALVVSLLLARRIVQPIRTLTEEVSRIEGDNLDFRFDLKTGDETQLLANSFESLTGRMKTYISDIQSITAEKERIGTELSLATRIQAAMLPNIFPAFPDRKDFDIYASMTPAKEVGGDFYDFFLIDEDRLGLVIADVSGKGIPAALFMMVSKILLQNHLMNGLSPAAALEKINEQICSNNREDMFVTVWLGVLDLKSGKLTAANAGHEYPILKKADGSFELIKDPHGFVVGGLPGMDYEEYEWQLEPGSKLFVYTDGVPEANVTRSALFGTDRLLEALRGAGDKTPLEIIESVDQAVRAYVGDAPQFDDLTMLCVHYIGKTAEEPPVRELLTRADIKQLQAVTDWADEGLADSGCPDKARNQLHIAIDEIFSNIAYYAYEGEDGPVCVRFELRDEPRAAVLSFADGGKPFDPLSKEDPDIELPAEERADGGLGIFLVKKLMDEVRYEYRDGQNILTIEKRF